MDFKELDYLITLADEKNISRAAERLFMAQSSLSHFIRQLESELGTTLFIRTPRGIIPTASGEQFLVHARHMLQEFHIAKNELCELNHLVKGTIQFESALTAEFIFYQTFYGVFIHNIPAFLYLSQKKQAVSWNMKF